MKRKNRKDRKKKRDQRIQKWIERDKGGASSLANVISNLLTGCEYEWIYRCYRTNAGKRGKSAREKTLVIIAVLRFSSEFYGTGSEARLAARDFFLLASLVSLVAEFFLLDPTKNAAPFEGPHPPKSFPLLAARRPSMAAEIFADSLETSCRNAIWMKDDQRVFQRTSSRDDSL